MITMQTTPTKRLFWSGLFLLLGFLQFSQAVFAESLFDFNAVNAPKKKKQHAAAIDSYMENLYGSEITVGRKIQIAGSAARSGRAAASLSADSGAFLKNRGRKSAITLSFDASPIDSFSVDSQVFKRGVGIVVKADGVIVYQHLLTKAEKRSGIMDSIDPIFFDTPVHTLQFIGLKRTKIGIDNLRVNLSEDQIGSDVPTPVVSVPEPSTLLMLGVGFLAAAWFARRSTARKRYRG
jgi:hypothetical protein